MTNKNNNPAGSTQIKHLLTAALCALAILGLAACDDSSTKPAVSESSTKPVDSESSTKPAVSESSTKPAPLASKPEHEPKPEPDDDGGSDGCTTTCTNHLKQITISPGRFACVAC